MCSGDRTAGMHQFVRLSASVGRGFKSCNSSVIVRSDSSATVRMTAYIAQLNAAVKRDRAQRAEKERVAKEAARGRLTPLEERLARLLATIPIEIQREGLSLFSLQASLRGRWHHNCHRGELGLALRKLGFIRRRQWHSRFSGSVVGFEHKMNVA